MGLDNGPLSFGIYANSPFMGYAGGIFNSGCGNGPNHEVVAIGWGNGYFVGLNSWGPNWGEGGGFRVADCVPTDFTLPGQISAHATIPLRSGGTTQPSGSADTAVDDDFAISVGGAPDSTGHFRVESGPCVAHADGCVSSPGYPGLYPNSESCVITPSSPFDSIDVLDFGTETWYDILTVDGVDFSGVDPGSGPDGVPVRDSIRWRADDSVNANGWFICPPTETAPTPPGTTPAPETPPVLVLRTVTPPPGHTRHAVVIVDLRRWKQSVSKITLLGTRTRPIRVSD